MFRYIDPLHAMCLIILVIETWMTWPKQCQLLMQWLQTHNKLSFVGCLALAFVASSSLRSGHRGAEAAGTPGTVTKIDEFGKPIVIDGHFVEFTGYPTEPGNYKVNIGNRWLRIHLGEWYKPDGGSKHPVFFLLHGAHESEPGKWAFQRTGMNQQADRNKFIAAYPEAQVLYKLCGTSYHAWNSELGTLSNFDDYFEEDALFIERAYDWLMNMPGVDRNNFNLAGFREGALMAADIARTGKLSINWLILAGGTMLEGQKFTKYASTTEGARSWKGPTNVFIQLALDDTMITPMDGVYGDVRKGTYFTEATWLLGYWNLGISRPSLQEKILVAEAVADEGRVSVGTRIGHIDGWSDRQVTLVRWNDGRVTTLVVDRVRWESAWLGTLEGGDPKLGIMPLKDYRLGENIANFICGHQTISAEPQIASQ